MLPCLAPEGPPSWRWHARPFKWSWFHYAVVVVMPPRLVKGSDAVSSPPGAMLLRLTSEVIVNLDGACSPWVLLLPLDCCW